MAGQAKQTGNWKTSTTPPDNHHCSDVVYGREGRINGWWYWLLLPADANNIRYRSEHVHSKSQQTVEYVVFSTSQAHKDAFTHLMPHYLMHSQKMEIKLSKQAIKAQHTVLIYVCLALSHCWSQKTMETGHGTACPFIMWLLSVAYQKYRSEAPNSRKLAMETAQWLRVKVVTTSTIGRYATPLAKQHSSM